MIQIYTGEGKGKTTSLFGLALRAIGAGKSVAIIQFIKKGNFSEHRAIKKYKLPIKIFTLGAGFYKILGDKLPAKVHIAVAKKAVNKTQEILKGDFDVVILDEIIVAISMKLVDENEIINLLLPYQNKKEIILSGRGASKKLIKMADLVTVMKKEKHYFDQGIKARKGIEY